jgi:hypothetical protein
MNLRNKLVSTVGILALSLSLTGGIASAAQGGVDATDKADTVVNVTCPYTTSVDVNVLGAFDVTAGGTATSYSADGVEFEIVMDLTCNWSTNFQVGAKIDEFKFKGNAPKNSASSFGGSALLLSGGDGVYVGPEMHQGLFGLNAGAPDVQGQVFEGSQKSDSDVIENDTFFFGLAGIASPGKTTATWDGSLSNLPANLAEGQYVAPLTVTLTVN